MKKILLLFLVLVVVLSQNSTAQFIEMPSGYDNLSSHFQQMGRVTYKKIVNDSFINSIRDINYEISTKMYFKKGLVDSKKMYDPKAYTSKPNPFPKKSSNGNNAEGEYNPCSIYPTSIVVNQHEQLDWDEIPREPKPFFLPKQMTKDTYKTNLGYLFINVMQTNTVKLYEVLGTQYINNQLGYGSFSLNFLKDIQFEDVGVSSNDRYFFNIEETVYIVNGESIYEFKMEAFKAKKLGELDTQNKRTLNVGILSRNQSYSTDFYIINPSEIQTYRIYHVNRTAPVDEDNDNQQIDNQTNQTNTNQTDQIDEEPQPQPVLLTVEKIRDYDEVTNKINTIRSGFYHQLSNNFYITGQDQLYVISAEGPDYLKKGYELNGSCIIDDNFQTTMHLLCNHKHIKYSLQAYFKDDTVILNRYYTDWDLEGIKQVIRSRYGKMLILGDQKFIVQSYGINRNVLLDLNHYQPYDVIPFPIGSFLFPIHQLTTPLSTSVLLLSQKYLKIVSIVQSPPELYCQFDEQSEGSNTYSVLMQFNVSRCPSIKQEQKEELGSLETYCTVSKPIIIKNVKKQLEVQQTNVISGGVIALIVIGVLIIIGCAIKMHRRIQDQVRQLRDKINKLKEKKGGGEMKKL